MNIYIFAIPCVVLLYWWRCCRHRYCCCGISAFIFHDSSLIHSYALRMRLSIQSISLISMPNKYIDTPTQTHSAVVVVVIVSSILYGVYFYIGLAVDALMLFVCYDFILHRRSLLLLLLFFSFSSLSLFSLSTNNVHSISHDTLTHSLRYIFFRWICSEIQRQNENENEWKKRWKIIMWKVKRVCVSQKNIVCGKILALYS